MVSPELEEAIRRCYAYLFSLKAAETKISVLQDEGFMKEEVLGVKFKDSQLFFFFIDWSLLIIDNKKNEMRIVDPNSLTDYIMMTHPFQHPDIKKLSESVALGGH